MSDACIKILVVDDDEVDRIRVRRHVARTCLNAIIEEASDGAAALRIAAGSDIDCILLDHILPDMDGLTVVEQLTARDENHPAVIMLTGQGGESLAVQFMKAGADDYIPKAELTGERLAKSILAAVRIRNHKREAAQAKLALGRSEALNRAVLASLQSQIAVIDRDGEIIAVNDAWTRFDETIGRAAMKERSVGVNYLATCESTPGLGSAVSAGIRNVLDKTAGSFSFEYPFSPPTGDMWFNLVATPLAHVAGGVVVSHTDISDRKAAEQRLIVNAFHDSLTGLPNRPLFLDRLTGALRHLQRRPDRDCAVLFIDLDHFKLINDGMGHSAGDQLLVEVAGRVATVVRETDTVARFGGDEFVVLLEDLNAKDDAVVIAGRILESLSQPIIVDHREVFTSASIGMVFASKSLSQPEELIRNADTAMYRAKATGRSCYQIFDEGMHTAAVATMQLRNDVRRAVEREELIVHYQPIVPIQGQRMLAFEALVRWRRATGETIPPADFIPIAEETGDLIGIDRWVMAQACAQTRAWQDSCQCGALAISVNLSVRQLHQADLVEHIDRVLSSTGLDGENLMLEITETVCLTDVEFVAGRLRALKKRGVKICIDDFGTGYSALSYLCRLPIDRVKIDRSFVYKLESTPKNLEIVRAVVAMSHELNMEVVAEGVETEEQLQKVRDIGCGFAQGFHILRPVAADKAAAFMEHEAPRLVEHSCSRLV